MRVKVLGQLLTPDGISVDPTKFDAFRQMVAPHCKRELENFQDIVNYLKYFICQLTQVAETLKSFSEMTHYHAGRLNIRRPLMPLRMS